MANELTTTDQPGASAMRISPATSRAVERWRSDLAADRFHLPDDIPAGSGSALRIAASETRAALSPVGAESAKAKLMGLRSSTQVRREMVEETEATIEIMARDLASVPADILAKAIRDYRVEPGQRFFPRAAGELMVFIAPMLQFRQRAARRLAQMAIAADNADRERARLAEDPLTAEAMAAIKAEYGLDRSPIEVAPVIGSKSHRAAPRMPDEAFYASQGIDPARAMEILAEGSAGLQAAVEIDAEMAHFFEPETSDVAQAA